MRDGFTIGVLAKNEGVATETLRYYERQGLISPSRRSESNYRLYDISSVRRLRFIRRAQALGFSLADIGELLSLNQQPAAEARAVKALAQSRIADIEAKIVDLQRMQAGLAALSARCNGRGKTADCPILNALLEEDH